MKQPYTIYHDSYVDRKTGERKPSPTFHIRFRDHLRRRQTIAAETRMEPSVTLANRLMQLIEARRHQITPEPSLIRWIESQPPNRIARLRDMDLVDDRWVAGEQLLIEHLEGRSDDAGLAETLGFKQMLEARGGEPKHVRNVVRNVRFVLTALKLVCIADAMNAGVATRISVHLARRRTAGEITGTTANYIIRDLKSFGRWMHRAGRVTTPLFEDLQRLAKAASDTTRRRALSASELGVLCRVTSKVGRNHHGLSADERVALYEFAFMTGLRPKAIASLTIGSFVLDGDVPYVVTVAKKNKRRERHEQVLSTSLVEKLRKRFKKRRATDRAFCLPDDPSEMLRVDLAAAREAWLAEANDGEDRSERLKSDFLAGESHHGEIVCFYSLRHSFGTALADAGVPQKDIAAAMHHSTTRMTERYLHSNRQSVAAAVNTIKPLNPVA